MNKQYIGGIVTGLLMAVSLALGFVLARVDTDMFAQQPTPTPPPSVTRFVLPTETITPTETIPPSSPLPTLTPSQTLRPPPTFEPPTATVQASRTPSLTPTVTIQVDVVGVPGLQGLPNSNNDTDTTATCEKREDWTLRYTVQPGDALSNIATLYGTLASELVLGNCLADANTIISGQILRVPGEAQPVIPKYVCTDWEALTPFDGAFAIDADDDLSFVWRGPVAERYLVRVIMPSGNIWEKLVDRQQNLQVFLPAVLREEGNHHWYVYPLGLDFIQIPCLEGGPWYFYKPAPTIPLTYTPSPTPTITNTPEPWMQTQTAAAS